MNEGSLPVSDSLNSEDPIIAKLKELNNRWQTEAAETANVNTVDLRETAELYHITEIFDPVKDKAGHLPFSDEYYAAMGTMIARI